MMRRAMRACAVAILLAGCGGNLPTPSTPAPTPSPPNAPSGTPPAGIVLPEPGRPFDASVVLDAMRDSRRPGGVPDAMQTDAVAQAVADAIWTYDGAPWTTMAAGGSCGPETCTLEMAGSRPEAPGDDVWVFSVTPSSGEVEVVTADLHALPTALAAELDATARAADGSGLLDELFLASVRWLPPPDEGQFVLGYRTGDEEGSCMVDVRVDADGRVAFDDGVDC